MYFFLTHCRPKWTEFYFNAFAKKRGWPQTGYHMQLRRSISKADRLTSLLEKSSLAFSADWYTSTSPKSLFDGNGTKFCPGDKILQDQEILFIKDLR